MDEIKFPWCAIILYVAKFFADTRISIKSLFMPNSAAASIPCEVKCIVHEMHYLCKIKKFHCVFNLQLKRPAAWIECFISRKINLTCSNLENTWKISKGKYFIYLKSLGTNISAGRNAKYFFFLMMNHFDYYNCSSSSENDLQIHAVLY